MVDLAKLYKDAKMLALAEEGDTEQLADYLENEGEITEDVRKELVKILRGENKRPANRPRKYSQKAKEGEVIHKLYLIAFALAVQGKKVTRNKLVELYLEQHSEANKNTVLKWIENWELETGQSLILSKIK